MNIRLNPKLETLNSKQTQNSKPKTQNRFVLNFGFRILDLFRISNLGFRVFNYLICIFGLWSLVFGLTLSGCGYTTKSLLPTHVKTVYVENFKNGIDITEEVSSKRPYVLYAPGLENEITAAIIDRFILDGNLQVVHDPEGADSVLSGELLEYTREPLRYDDNQEVTEYRVRVASLVKFFDKRNNNVIWRSASFAGESSQRTEGALTKSEEVAKAEAVKDLARRVIEKTIEVW
jgi:hypothetical protein